MLITQCGTVFGGFADKVDLVGKTLRGPDKIFMSAEEEKRTAYESLQFDLDQLKTSEKSFVNRVKSDAEPPITDIGFESDSGPEAIRLAVATDETVFSLVTYVNCPMVRSVLVPSLLFSSL